MKTVIIRNSLLKTVSIAALLLVTIGLTLFRHIEPGGETWGYWAFSRIFAETGRFIIVDRGPLYILYLNVFRWMGYPLAVTVEYLITSLVIAISMIVFFKRYIGLFLSVLAVILWMPFFQTAEPPVQKLALAFSCLALALRTSKESRFRIALFYALLGCVYLLRSTYLIFIIIFAAWDIARALKGRSFKLILAGFKPRINDWPIFCVAALSIWFNISQSDHPWNNAWLATSKWFPNDGKSLADASFIQNYNWQYIYHKYGGYEGKDFYFTNHEVFNGASTMIGAITANPGFVIKQALRNAKKAFFILVSLTLLSDNSYKFLGRQQSLCYAGSLIFTVIFIVALFYGAYRLANGDRFLKVFIIANAFLVLAAVVSLPKARYMHPIIPIFVLSAYWYGNKLRSIFLNIVGNKIIPNLSMALVFIFFSTGLRDWGAIIKDFSRDISKGEIGIMQSQGYSLKAHFEEIEPQLKDCNGILTFEHTFVSAFMRVPIERVYDIWEIPPFGHFGDANYDGLNPKRINCVLVSYSLVTDIGYATNSQIRYQNYIMPYVQKLKNMAADVKKIEGFGEVVKCP